MELLILGWYILTETHSVAMLTVFASLTFIGTLIAPMVGVMADRVGHRNVLGAMRGLYLTLSLTLMTLSFLGLLHPWLVLSLVFVFGLVKPSDIGMRNALIGETIPTNQLMGSMGIQRMTQDAARITGALTGAGLVAALGMSYAYLLVASLYASATFLTFQAGSGSPARPKAVEITSPWRDLKVGMVYTWKERHLFGVMVLAVLLNATAFPTFVSLLPAATKELFAGDQRLLGFLVASGATGALVGSSVMTHFGRHLAPGRTMILASVMWHLAILAFVYMPTPGMAMLCLFVGGISQNACLIPMTGILLRHVAPAFRGRVMGIRMLAIYGNLPGLLLSGPLIVSLGYAPTVTLYCVFGIVCTLWITFRWRDDLWKRGATTNRV